MKKIKKFFLLMWNWKKVLSLIEQVDYELWNIRVLHAYDEKAMIAGVKQARKTVSEFNVYVS